MSKKNAVLQELKSSVEALKDEKNGHAVSRIIRSIHRNVENSYEWEQFISTFKSIHSSFLDNLQKLSTELTSNEIRLASLMKMNLSSKEIASTLNISGDGVKKARYRLRKKLALDSDINLHDYIVNLT